MGRPKNISDEEVLEGALNVVIEKGPHRFTLPEVSRAVGVAPATLIQRFGSKATLLDLVIDHSTRRLEESRINLGEKGGDPREALVEWLVSVAAGFGSRERIAGNLALLMEDISDDDRRKRAKKHLSVINSGIAAFLKRGGFSNPSAAALMIEAHWHGLIIQWAIHGRGSLASWLRKGLRQLLDMLEARDLRRADH